MSADWSGKATKKIIGINTIEWMLDIALGKNHMADMIPESLEPPYKAAQFTYFQFADRDGMIASMQGYSDLDPERFQVSIVSHVGDAISKYRLMACIVFNVAAPKEMCESIQYINSKTRILDEYNENIYSFYKL